jgi:hypothetical protein
MVKVVHRPSEQVFCKTWWNFTIISVSKSSVRHGDIRHGRMSPCLTEDLLTEMIVKFHHVLQKTCSLGRWTTFTMSYTRFTHWGDGRISPCLTEDWLTHWDNGRISPCLTENLLTETMNECHHGNSSIAPVCKSCVRHGESRPSSQWASLL